METWFCHAPLHAPELAHVRRGARGVSPRHAWDLTSNIVCLPGMADSPGVTLAVTWMAKPGHEGDIKDILMRLAEESRREPGCRQYIVHQSAGDPALFLLYEQYASPKAFK